MQLCKQNFNDSGFLFLSDIPEDFRDLCLSTNEILTQIIEGKVRTKKKWARKDGLMKQSVDVHKKFPLFKKIMTHKVIREVIDFVFDSNPVYINHSKISFKFSNDQVWFPHQDVAYKKNHQNKGITVAILLEKIQEENGSIYCHEGSHKNGYIEHNVVFHDNEKEPQIFVSDEKITNHPKVSFAGNAGDVLFFDFNTVHSSNGNTLGGSRPILIFEVEAIIGVPLESDGSNAIVFNYNYPLVLFTLHKKVYNFARNVVIFPIAKKVLYQLHRFNLLPKFKL